jgi:excisionase family DNA binding protein
MTERAVVYSVRHQAGEIQRTRERLRQQVEAANGCRAHIEITLLDGPPELVRVPLAEVVPDYLSAREAGRLLGCSRDTVVLRCREGKLDYRMEGTRYKVSRTSLERYLGGQR